jgi:hypothetical protein
VNRYVYCQDTELTPPGTLTFTDAATEYVSFSAMTDDFLYFEFDFADAAYSDWSNIGISNFEFNVIFVGSTDEKKRYCNSGDIYWTFSTNIPENIFRALEVSINLKTWEYSTDAANVDNFNTI